MSPPRVFFSRDKSFAVDDRKRTAAALSISKALQATAESMYETSQNSMTVVSRGR